MLWPYLPTCYRSVGDGPIFTDWQRLQAGCYYIKHIETWLKNVADILPLFHMDFMRKKIVIKISLNIVPEDPIDNMSPLSLVVPRRRTGDKSSPE